MKIGYRTIKTAVGTPLAIWIAELLQLENSVSAGILTILCTQVTRKKSFLAAWHRVAACMLAIMLSFVIFETIGFHPISIGILLLIFIPLTVMLRVSPGIVSSAVIILHLYNSHGISLDLIINEMILITVGIGVALIVNLYMPSLEATIRKKQIILERNFTKILNEIALYLRKGDQSWSGEEITETEKILKEANQLVGRDVENHVLRSEHPYYDYFEMRTKQFSILKRILPLVSRLPETSYSQCEKLAHFFAGLADSVHPGNTAVLFLEELEGLRQSFDEDPLPKTREEFETRAHLLQLLYEMENYLELKQSFKASDLKHRNRQKEQH
ncbi:aromatic acid exporter family protein [Terribacillus saccharophilus]|uniref:aromatic acid exporter family protein n=1 Tax=Terribacillus saccharophilus TaxID=361277 RepID=UPI003981ACBA